MLMGCPFAFPPAILAPTFDFLKIATRPWESALAILIDKRAGIPAKVSLRQAYKKSSENLHFRSLGLSVCYVKALFNLKTSKWKKDHIIWYNKDKSGHAIKKPHVDGVLWRWFNNPIVIKSKSSENVCFRSLLSVCYVKASFNLNIKIKKDHFFDNIKIQRTSVAGYHILMG